MEVTNNDSFPSPSTRLWMMDRKDKVLLCVCVCRSPLAGDCNRSQTNRQVESKKPCGGLCVCMCSICVCVGVLEE